ncbi:thioredoxin family protein [Oceanospirillum sanctuarii]|uniref:thioredoxin family protein n=1 Tax=Oceanospirillum sanctuarii TaxID=1434821 RepID=UPI000A3AB460|nr:thioredoxin family protein [Oceanospirillum sanctuarii]
MTAFVEACNPDEMAVSSGLAFLLFSTPDCGVCDALKIKLPQWAESQGYKAEFRWLNLSRFPEASSRFQVLSVPTLIVSLDGQELTRQLRHVNLRLIQEQIARPLALWSEP